MFQKVSDERQMGTGDKSRTPPENRAPASVCDNSIGIKNNPFPQIFDSPAQVNITAKHWESFIQAI